MELCLAVALLRGGPAAGCAASKDVEGGAQGDRAAQSSERRSASTQRAAWRHQACGDSATATYEAQPLIPG